MGSLIRLGDSGGSITTTTTIDVATAPQGAVGKLHALCHITAINGQFDITLQKRIAGTTIDVATLANQTTTGMKDLVLDAAMSGATTPNTCVAFPDRIVFNKDSGTSMTGVIYLMFAEQ